MAIVIATIPAVADPSTVAGTTHLASSGSVQTVPGAGGYAGQQAIRLTPAPSPADPLRVMIIGDSVMHDASYGITASLQATGEATVTTKTYRRVRAHHRDQLAHVHPQSDSPDRGAAHRGLVELGPVRPDDAQRAASAQASTPRFSGAPSPPCWRRATAWRVSSSPQFPQSGDLAAASPAATASYNKERRAGVVAWNDIAEKMAADFPGRVMYFPLADSVLLHGKYSAWLPPEGDPHAPSNQWLRVRKLDNVHLCPEGSARYAAALLADMTTVFRLAPADGNWSQGAWTTDPDFNDPPGACPDDHPPG